MPTPLTPADKVTLTRAFFTCGVAMLMLLTVVQVLPTRSWALFTITVPTVALDAVDGWVARRTGLVTSRGARWDMEVDAALFLVLSVALLPLGWWVLGIGVARYLFWFGSRLRPRWRKPLPFSQSRRVIAGFQAVALTISCAPLVPEALARGLLASSLALLVFSFVRDIVELERAVEPRVLLNR